MALAAARYVQTTTQRSNATNWAIGLQQAWFNTTRKSTPLVTHATSGTPLVSQFTINAPGLWTLSAGLIVSSGTTFVGISTSPSNENGCLARCGTIISPNCTVEAELNYLQVLYVLWNLSAAGTVNASGGDSNFVSFLYHGPV